MNDKNITVKGVKGTDIEYDEAIANLNKPIEKNDEDTMVSAMYLEGEARGIEEGCGVLLIKGESVEAHRRLDMARGLRIAARYIRGGRW